MFVKPGTSFQKLLDKKPLRTTAYGDSKGLKHFRKFTIMLHLLIHDGLFSGGFPLLENNFIGIYKY